MSSFSVTVSNYSFDEVVSESILDPIVIPAGEIKLVGTHNGLGKPREIDGVAYITWNLCPDGAEILFEDGLALRFDPDNVKVGKHSIYSVSSYEFEILSPVSSYAKCTYVITDDDHDKINDQEIEE
ncbi:MAG: hypothetical protein J6T30_01185 [Bacteroidales bacterium]|nr:hypothetical protein [Bacteroidales bacterium]